MHYYHVLRYNKYVIYGVFILPTGAYDKHNVENQPNRKERDNICKNYGSLAICRRKPKVKLSGVLLGLSRKFATITPATEKRPGLPPR